MAPKGTTKIECPACGGRKVVAVGDMEVPCATCDGTGEVYEDVQK